MAVLGWVLLALYATLKWRHGGAVWRDLGWTLPPWQHLAVAAPVGGVPAAAVTLIGRSAGRASAPATTWTFIPLAVMLGPIVEESFFRGCLLPLVAKSTGNLAAIILTAVLFAVFHRPPTVLHCACFAMSGIFYGWSRADSGSTTTPALMHCIYNLALLATRKM